MSSSCNLKVSIVEILKSFMFQLIRSTLSLFLNKQFSKIDALPFFPTPSFIPVSFFFSPCAGLCSSSARWPLTPYFSLGRLGNLGALSVFQNWPARRNSYSNKNFTSTLSNQISQILNTMPKGDGFSAKTLGRSFFNWQNDCSSHGLAGQFWQMESALVSRNLMLSNLHFTGSQHWAPFKFSLVHSLHALFLLG